MNTKDEVKLSRSHKKWKNTHHAKQRCLAVLKEANLGKDFKTLTDLEKCPEYYEYQHPIRPDLKTSNVEEEWVKLFLEILPMGKKGNPYTEAKKGGMVGKKGNMGVMSFETPGEKETTTEQDF